MMTIRNIQRFHGIEGMADLLDHGRVLHYPECVSDTIIGLQVDVRHASRHALEQGINIRLRLIGQQYRAGLGIQSLYLAYPVILLVRAGEFMLANPVTVIGGYRSRGDQPICSR
jgi:hypothetical protein